MRCWLIVIKTLSHSVFPARTYTVSRALVVTDCQCWCRFRKYLETKWTEQLAASAKSALSTDAITWTTDVYGPVTTMPAVNPSASRHFAAEGGTIKTETDMLEASARRCIFDRCDALSSLRDTDLHRMERAYPCTAVEVFLTPALPRRHVRVGVPASNRDGVSFCRSSRFFPFNFLRLGCCRIRSIARLACRDKNNTDHNNVRPLLVIDSIGTLTGGGNKMSLVQAEREEGIKHVMSTDCDLLRTVRHGSTVRVGLGYCTDLDRHSVSGQIRKEFQHIRSSDTDKKEMSSLQSLVSQHGSEGSTNCFERMSSCYMRCMMSYHGPFLYNDRYIIFILSLSCVLLVHRILKDSRDYQRMWSRSMLIFQKKKHERLRLQRERDHRRGYLIGFIIVFLVVIMRIGEAQHPGPRVRTHNKHNYMVIATANKNCFNTLTTYLASCTAQVVCGQEIHKKGKAFWKCKSSLDKGSYVQSNDGRRIISQAWRGEGAQAVDGPNGGTSGGAMIMTKPHLDIAPPVVIERDDKNTRNKYELIPGHLTAVVLNGWFGTRLLILNVYMDQKDGTGLKNRAIMMMIGITIETMGMPYIIAGDINLTPSELVDTGWVESIRGKIVASDEVTCRPTPEHAGKVLDYFIVSDWMAPLVYSIQVVQGDTYQPHCAVELTLMTAVNAVYEYRVMKPLAFPEERPIVSTEEPAVHWGDTPFDMQLEDHAKWWIRRAEAELIAIFDVNADNEGIFEKYTGRDQGFVLQKAKASTGMRKDGCSPTSTLLTRLGFQLHDLALETTKACAESTTRRIVIKQMGKVVDTIYRLRKGGSVPDFVQEILDCINDDAEFGLEDVVKFNMWAYYCDVNAKQHNIDEAKQRAGAYRKFLDKAIKHKNGQIIHAMVKPRPDVIARAVQTKQGITTTNQAHADEQIDIWAEHWEVGKYTDDATDLEQEVDYSAWRQPTNEEIEDLRHTCRSFKINTAVAYDNLRPKQFAELSDEALSQLIKLYWRCEQIGCWPEVWRNATMVMIPKAEEGKWRLIAMLVAPYRIWARHCNKTIAHWMREQDREWVAYGPGCSAEGATYDAALEAERHTGRYTDTVVTIIGDLEKGFEKVIHRRLRAAAKAYKFPMTILNLALNMYKSNRRIRCGSAYSRPVKTNMGVLAGCPIAMVALLLACIDPVEEFLRWGPRYLSVFKVYVDDFSLTFTFGGCNYNPHYMAEVVEASYRKLGENLRGAGLVLSIDKNKAVTNNSEVEATLTKNLKDIRLKCTDQIVKLGVDYAAGNPISHGKAKERLKKAHDKRDAIMAYCKGGWRTFNIVRAHVVSAALYGASVHGVPPAQLLKIRTLMRSTTSTKAHGGSTTVALALQRDPYADPAYRATLAPIQEWAIRVNRAAYEKDTATTKKLSTAWEAQKRVLMTSTDPWKHICGPASATMATLIGIGWKPLSFKVWITDCNRMVDLTETIPYQVKHILFQAVERKLWLASSLAIDDEHHLDPTLSNDELDRPYWYPMRTVVLGKDKKVGGAARSVAANTQWDQARLACTNYVDEDDNMCRACGEDVGNLEHRHHPQGCKAMAPYVQEVLGEEAIKYWTTTQSRFLLKHGIMMRRELPHCPEATATDDQQRVLHTDREVVFSGFTYVDGSGKPCRFVPQLGRAGYGVVDMGDVSLQSGLLAADDDEAERPDPAERPQCGCHNRSNPYHECSPHCAQEGNTHTDDNGRVVEWRCDSTCHVSRHTQPTLPLRAVQAVYGPLVGYFQTTPRAELQALIIALKHGKSPQTIVSDHKNHVVAINKISTYTGKRKVLDMKGPMLDQWRQVVEIIEARGGLNDEEGDEQLMVIWQPSHLRAHRGETACQKMLRRGNDGADTAANWGRQLHDEVTNNVIRVKYLFDRACEWATWVGFAAAIQYESGHICDHVLHTDTYRLTDGAKCSLPMLPKEARILRRFPWAARSLGTVEHRQLQQVNGADDDTVPYNHPVGIATRARVAVELERDNRAQRVSKFCERFSTVTHGRGVKALPQHFIPEKDEWLPTSMTLGHAMHTVGLFPLQYLWCEKCGAHTCERVRALKHPCKNKMGNPFVADRLTRGRHPYNDTALATATRRLTVEDIGYSPDGNDQCGFDAPCPLW